MNPALVLVFGLALLLGGSGCRAVYSEKMVGLQPLDLTAEQEDWSGTWINSEGDAVMVEVTDASLGALQLTHWDNAGGTNRLRRLPAWIRATGDTRLVNFQAEDKEHPGARYTWARIRRNNREMLVWLPDPDRIAEKIATGELPGSAKEQGDVFLGPLTEEQQAFLAGEKGAPLFRWQEPAVFFRAK